TTLALTQCIKERSFYPGDSARRILQDGVTYFAHLLVVSQIHALEFLGETSEQRKYLLLSLSAHCKKRRTFTPADSAVIQFDAYEHVFSHMLRPRCDPKRRVQLHIESLKT